VILNQ
jgi:hypothetical protein